MQPEQSNPIDKALWYIESHFAADIGLDEVARAAGVSRFHMTRAFGVATGHSIMRYVRARRLSEAARALAKGAPDILSVALDWGYGSHEAFTRAFRDQFGITPEELRSAGRIDSLDIVEPIRMNATHDTPLDPPRFVDAPALLVAGLAERYSYEACAGIPGPYDGVMALCVLQHVGREELGPLLARIAAALRLGGVFLFSLVEGAGERWEGAARNYHVVLWREELLRVALAGAGFEVDWIGRMVDNEGPWMTLLARKAAK